jgi:hypothetical protein
VGIYMKVYNFELDPLTHKAEGEVQYQVVKNGTNEPVLDFTENVSELSGGAAQMIIQKLLPLQNFAPGDYTLKMKVMDKKRNQTLTPTATFTVL